MHAGNNPELGAEIAQVRARAELHQGRYVRAAELLLDAAASEEIGDARASRLYSEAAIALIPTARGKEALEIAQRAVDLAAVDGQDRFVAGVLVDYIQFLRGERGAFNGVGLAEMVEGIEFNVELGEQFALACHVLLWHELFDRARVLADRALEAARALSALTVIPNLLAAKAQLEFRTGNWALAHAAAAEAVILGRETGVGSSPFALAYLAQIEAVLGLEAESRRHAGGAIEIAASQQNLAALDYAYAALGQLELGLGNIQRATAELKEVEHLQSLTGLRDPSVSPWQPDLIEAYVRSGRTDDAWELLRSFEQMAEQTGRSWPRAAAHRCRGLLVEAGFDDEFEEAIRCHLEAPGPFELARTELAYGQRLRRDRRRVEARERLRSALASFEWLGAQPWASLARQELAATGETARRGDRVAADELTPQEIQVAALVAAGVSNKEAAARLFISPRTVDAHLGRVYRKLDIHSRGELADALAAFGISPSSAAGGSPMRAQPVPDASPAGAVLSSTDGDE